MDLGKYLEMTQETLIGFATRCNVSVPLIRGIIDHRTPLLQKRTPLLRTAIAIEEATDGEVNAIDLITKIEGYEPIDPEWRAWWAKRPRRDGFGKPRDTTAEASPSR
jgi:hypothetical protein